MLLFFMSAYGTRLRLMLLYRHTLDVVVSDTIAIAIAISSMGTKSEVKEIHRDFGFWNFGRGESERWGGKEGRRERVSCPSRRSKRCARCKIAAGSAKHHNNEFFDDNNNYTI